MLEPGAILRRELLFEFGLLKGSETPAYSHFWDLLQIFHCTGSAVGCLSSHSQIWLMERICHKPHKSASQWDMGVMMQRGVESAVHSPVNNQWIGTPVVWD